MAFLATIRTRSAVGAVLGAAVLLTSRVTGTAASPQAAPPPALQVGTLAQDVRNEDPRIRRSALKALAESGAVEALPLLGALVADPDNGIQARAIAAVLSLYVEPLPKDRVGSAEDAFGLAPWRVVPWPAPIELRRGLISALADDSIAVRRDAVYALGVVMQPPLDARLADEVLASLSDRDASVRRAAARVLGTLRVTSAGVPLIGRVNDEVLDVRLAAMRSLGDIRERRAVQALTEQFAFYGDTAGARAALDALARIGHPDSVPLFAAQATSRHAPLRLAAHEGLARTGAAAGLRTEIQAARQSERVETVAIAMDYALATAGDDLIGQIAGGLQWPKVQQQALEYLVELGARNPEAVAAQIARPEADVRRDTAVVLGFLGGPVPTSALSRAAIDASPEVQRAAQVALARARLAR
jgi:HEAT repeat protein